MLDLTALLLTAIVVAVSASIISRKWRWSQVEKLPGHVALPLLGTTYVDFFTKREDRIRSFDEVCKKFGPIFRFWLGPYPVVHISKPEYMEKVLSSSEIIDKSHFYAFLYPWLGQGLLTSTGSKWHMHRKMITPAFHFRILDNFVEIFAENGEILVEKLKPKADGKAFDMYPFITRCALDIICETAMGTSVNAQNQTQSAYVNAVTRISELTVERMINPWMQSDFIFERTSSAKEYYDQLKILHGFTKKGHDTTSVAMSWVLVLLGHHPDIQEKIFAEQDDIFQDDPKRRPTTHDLNSMKYLEMVIKEALRLYPSVPGVSRRVTKEIEVGGYTVPEGCTIFLNIRQTHRDPDQWPNPEFFDPDNFLPDRVQGRHPYAYVPFSAGPRNCIGQKFAILEEKAVLSYVLRNFRVETVDRLEDLQLIGELVLRPMNGVNLRLLPR
ncbi:cytochrome P450 4C1-like isoform X2 [Schistocerca gregaria]|uniref:cytochrome P450 4C1-like isoform X2 n=1 Tax=Schistocerca gregaria TaxID=7010 RepID=UPI00211F3BDC|nr:cytochrome P450 4C1-like isoform X2 [Schistocerca gregaria]